MQLFNCIKLDKKRNQITQNDEHREQLCCEYVDYPNQASGGL